MMHLMLLGRAVLVATAASRAASTRRLGMSALRSHLLGVSAALLS